MRLRLVLSAALLVSPLVGAAGCATPSNPCDPNPCVAPPGNACQGTVAQIYPAQGVCEASGGEAVCSYLPAETDCADTGLYCSAGQCVADPCSPNPCTSEPADACDGDVLVRYEHTGSCELVDDAVECSYAEADRTDCIASGMACVDGACQSTTDPCSPNPCTSAPADFCTGAVASVYPSVGACTDSGGGADCAYTAVEVDCADNGLECQDGACVAPVDPCSPNPCTSPPAPTCSGDTATQYPATGTCADVGGSPDCTYGPTTVDCTQTGQVCQAGLCVTAGDPCNPNPCTSPPADDCSGDTANHYPSTGTCTDNGGQAACAYTPSTVDCTQTSQVCAVGACVTPDQGGVMISEYVEGSSLNKYLEIFNGGSSSVDLAGYEIHIYTNGSTTISRTVTLPSYLLLPGAVYVVGNGGGTIYTPDFASGSINFNGNDAVELVDASLSRLDILGTIGDTAIFAEDVTLVRKAGIVSGSQTYDAGQWTSLAKDTQQLGSHTP